MGDIVWSCVGLIDRENVMGPAGYAVTPDGHFYFLRTTRAETRPRRIQVVLNWIEEFEQRVAK